MRCLLTHMILRRVGLSHRNSLKSGEKAARLAYFARGPRYTDFEAARRFITCCLRFTTGVAARHARLASGWLAGPLPGGSRTRWVTMKGFNDFKSSYPPFQSFPDAMTIRWSGDETERFTSRVKGKRGLDEAVVPSRMPIMHYLRPGVPPLPPKMTIAPSRADRVRTGNRVVADPVAVTARRSGYGQGHPARPPVSRGIALSQDSSGQVASWNTALPALPAVSIVPLDLTVSGRLDSGRHRTSLQ